MCKKPIRDVAQPKAAIDGGLGSSKRRRITGGSDSGRVVKVKGGQLFDTCCDL